MRATKSLYAHQAISLSPGGLYSLNHFSTRTVCLPLSSHFPLAVTPRKVLTWHSALRLMDSHKNNGRKTKQWEPVRQNSLIFVPLLLHKVLRCLNSATSNNVNQWTFSMRMLKSDSLQHYSETMLQCAVVSDAASQQEG